jgi:hypothetical protein
MFLPEREEEVEGWKALYNDELYNFYVAPNASTMSAECE